MIYRRILPSVMLGAAAYFLALGVGIPAWRDWVPGDASDIGGMVAIAAFIFSKRQDL